MPSTKKVKQEEPKIISTEEIYEGQTVLAFVIDGEVVLTFMCDDRMAAIIQSKPEIVDVTERDPFLYGPHMGWLYDGKDFMPPMID
jgi:hypothetical protein